MLASFRGDSVSIRKRHADVQRECSGPAVRCRIEDRHVSITFGQMITRAQPIDVLFVVVPHSLLLDIAGPAEAFRLANWHRELHGLPPRFRLRFAAPAPTQDTSVGLSIAGLEPLPAKLAETTWVVVVGQPTKHLGDATPGVQRVARWLNERLRDSLLGDFAGPSSGDDLLGHAARGARRSARRPALHHAPRAAAQAARAGAAGEGDRQPGLRRGWPAGVERRDHGGDRRRAAPHRRGVRGRRWPRASPRTWSCISGARIGTPSSPPFVSTVGICTRRCIACRTRS